MWHDFLVAIALLLVIEGILPFLSPQAMRRVMIVMAQFDDHKLRFTGLTSMLVGVVMLFVFK